MGTKRGILIKVVIILTLVIIPSVSMGDPVNTNTVVEIARPLRMWPLQSNHFTEMKLVLDNINLRNGASIGSINFDDKEDNSTNYLRLGGGVATGVLSVICLSVGSYLTYSASHIKKSDTGEPTGPGGPSILYVPGIGGIVIGVIFGVASIYLFSTS